MEDRVSEHLFQVLLLLAGAVVGTVVGFVPGYVRRMKRELKAEGRREQLDESRDLALTNEAKERGKLERRVDELEGDLQGVADMARARFEKLEKKDTALETFVTGKMPRASGESERAS
jgi:hypothetical protein